MSRILVVEDEEGLAGAIRDWLSDELYVVKTVCDGISALEELRSEAYEAAILDLMIPGIDGIEVCRTYRLAGGRIPILMLTARSALSSKEAGLDSGADDYLTKPFDLRELSARVRALLRRPKTAPVTTLSAGNLILNRSTRTVTRSGKPVRLLPKEFILLEVLLSHPGVVLSAEDLISHVWPSNSEITTDTVRSHLKALRKKIDDNSSSSLIKTVHGMGYKIEATTDV